MHAFEVTGRRLGTAVLLYLGAAVAVITLAPFHFEPRPVQGLTARWGAFDVVMNVAMFVPIGFVYALSRARGRSGGYVSLGGALALGALLSGALELAQVFAPSRFPSVFDLIANTTGAGLGARLAGAATAAARSKGDAVATVRALSVDLPLMGLVYLMAPLVWLVALGADDVQRLWIAGPLAAAAAWILASVLVSFEQVGWRRVLMVTSAWLAVTLLPSAVQRTGPTVVVALLAVATAWARTAAPARLTHETSDGRPTRRFEAATLRIVLPLFAVFAVLSAWTPLSPPADAWSGTLALVPRSEDLADPIIYRALEQIAAFAILGYAVAEYHGRARHRLGPLLVSVLLWTVPASAALQWIRGWHPDHGASGLLVAATTLAACGGGWLYVLQLEHVRALGARPPSLGDSAAAG